MTVLVKILNKPGGVPETFEISQKCLENKVPLYSLINPVQVRISLANLIMKAGIP